MSGSLNEKWMKRQRILPKCIAIEAHELYTENMRYEYVFENSDCVMRQYFGKRDRVSIEDYYSDEVLAYADDVCDHDHVRCAEMMYKTARGSEYIGKEIVDSIIYKLMVGDIELIED